MKRILASHGRRNRVLWESITCVTTSGEGEKNCQIGNGRLSRPTDGSSLRERPVLGTCGPQTSLECAPHPATGAVRSEEHTSELQSHSDLVCRLLLEKKKRTVPDQQRSKYP